MLTGVADFAQSSSWIFENVTAEKTVSKVANVNTKSATTASFFPLFFSPRSFCFPLKDCQNGLETFKRVFENVPSEICSHLSEKNTKRRPKSPKITSTKENERKD